jgi:hypothetical protein
MKTILILFTAMAVIINIEAQNLSVEFSIEWKKDLDFQIKELNDELIHPAFLNITYRNISDKPLYCLKVADGINGLPMIFPYNILFDSYKNSRSIRQNVYDDFSIRRYVVGFKNSELFMDNSWFIINDTTDVEYKKLIKDWKPQTQYDSGHIDINTDNGEKIVFPGKIIPLTSKDSILPTSDWISSEISNIYGYIYYHYYSKTAGIDTACNRERHFYSSDFVDNAIQNCAQRKFVFLKPGETFVDAYNLIGFQITGGTFTFQLDDTKSLDYVKTVPVHKERNVNATVQYSTQKLPEKVGIYELFKGDFLTNKATVQFPEIKTKK